MLEIGPTIGLYTTAVASVTGSVSASMNFDYQLKGTKFNFPSNAGSTLGTFTPSDSKSSLIGDATVGLSGTASVQLIPKVCSSFTGTFSHE